MNDNPHLHANVYLATMYQYLSLNEIADLMRNNIVQLQDVTTWQDWVCCEDYHDLAAHESKLPELEKHWSNHNSDEAATTLSSHPAYLWKIAAPSLWENENNSLDVATLIANAEDGKKFKAAYMKDADFVFSRVHHHWHALNAKTKEREPLRTCRAKKGIGCKHNFPMTKRLNLIPKVICPGNCRKHGLRVSGRRNALGSVLNKRREEWRSGSGRAYAVIFRHNTHKGPNYRVPLLPSTHDPECKANCLEKHATKTMTAAAQRAQRNTTGYYTGYIHKVQRVGKFSLRQATRNLKSLSSSIEQRTQAQQFHHVANRLLGDLEYRGHVRPATEECNLAGNHHANDVYFAEFIRSFQSSTFHGNQLLQRLRSEINSDGSTRVYKLRTPFPGTRTRDKANVSFDASYGFRGKDPQLRYLCPWEFVKYWFLEPLRDPQWYQYEYRQALTMWTEKGLAYRETLKQDRDKSLPAPKPGEHYVVAECLPENYVAYPNAHQTADLRHRFVMVRVAEARVPMPKKTPFPSKGTPPEDRGRMLCLYFRPWTLLREFAIAHVPHIVDLDISISGKLASKKRLSGKQKWTEPAPLERSYAHAWEDYRRHHVVSKHAAGTIKSFLLAQMHVSAEVDAEDETTGDKEKIVREVVATDWASVDRICDLMNVEPAARSCKKTKHGEAVDRAKTLTCNIWTQAEEDGEADLRQVVNRDGSIHPSSLQPVTGKSEDAHVEKPRRKKDARLFYDGSLRDKATAWMEHLFSAGLHKDIRKPKPKPNAKQQACIRTIVGRCVQESEEELLQDVKFRSEPLSLLIHGVPGAGKSEVLYWLRDFFEEICLWEHGVQFVYLVSTKYIRKGNKENKTKSSV